MAAPTFKLAVLVASMVSASLGLAPRSAYCPSGCQCVWLDLVCDGAGLQAVPAGDNYAYVTTLFLGGNAIAALPQAAFASFPQLSTVVLDDNALAALDLRVLARSPALEAVRAARNQISSVVPADALEPLRALETLDLSFNRLSALDPHVFDAASSLRYLYLDGNPLLLPSDGPLLVHQSVASLSLAGVDGSALSPLTLSALPNLFALKLNASGVRHLSGALAAATELYSVELQGNDVAALPGDAFAPGVRLDVLRLDGNPLETIELAALSVLRNRTTFSIADTTIACSCAYQDVWEWSQRHGVLLDATCASAPPCDFGQ